MSDPRVTANPFFIEANSPYRIPFESAGKYAILVRAHDKAGNFRESKSNLSVVGSLISYTENGIKIKNLFLPWWFIYILIDNNRVGIQRLLLSIKETQFSPPATKRSG
jgi:hypothetical protein